MAWFNFQTCGLICFWNSGAKNMNPNTSKAFSHVFTWYSVRLLLLILEYSGLLRLRLAASYSWFFVLFCWFFDWLWGFFVVCLGWGFLGGKWWVGLLVCLEFCFGVFFKLLLCWPPPPFYTFTFCILPLWLTEQFVSIFALVQHSTLGRSHSTKISHVLNIPLVLLCSLSQKLVFLENLDKTFWKFFVSSRTQDLLQNGERQI